MMMEKQEYERPIVVDYGSIADHTFGDALSNSSAGVFPARPDVPSF
jgi:hypothetical protein